MKLPKLTVNDHMKLLGLVKKFDIWIPHELIEIHLTKRINACDLHLRRKSSLVIKNGLFIITSIGNIHGPSVMTNHKTPRRFCCQFGGIGNETWLGSDVTSAI